MGPTVCRGCRAEISADAKECPACGLAVAVPTLPTGMPAPVAPMRPRLPSDAPTNPYGIDDDE